MSLFVYIILSVNMNVYERGRWRKTIPSRRYQTFLEQVKHRTSIGVSVIRPFWTSYTRVLHMFNTRYDMPGALGKRVQRHVRKRFK